MCNRPALIKGLESQTFRQYYYLKEELVQFCREENLQATGGKIELTERIAHYLENGERTYIKRSSRPTSNVLLLTTDSYVESNFKCSQMHREFFKSIIGPTFSFNVTFQNWLKENEGKTYQEAISAYHQIMENKKMNRTTIDRQFEYNTYIRDFFDDNKGSSLQAAIACWKYKKSQPGHNRYEREDLLSIGEMLD